MVYSPLSIIPLRSLLFVGGTAAITWGLARQEPVFAIVGCILLFLAALLQIRNQKLLQEKCHLMLEAIRNNDYTFRMYSKRHLSSERVLQETLNRFGQLMSEQKQSMEQQERFYEQILRNVNTGIIVLDIKGSIKQANGAAARLFHLPFLSTLKQLERLDGHVVHTISQIAPGEHTRLNFSTPTGDASISVSAAQTLLNGQPVRILVLNDVKADLEENEVESWIKLTRVLTHEIMNSISPIASISETFMSRQDVRQSAIYEGIRAIHDTSAGLINFVDSYRKFSSLQQPQPQAFELRDVLRQIEELRLIPDNISYKIIIEPSDLMLFADPNLVRQIIINLLRNAVQAIGANNGRIAIHAYIGDNEHVFIQISNNGPAIPTNVAEQIFVPFFTTKTDGNGIGLSLSRQIMKLSGGSISLMPAGYQGWNTSFVLEFT